jgi:hypothetical protein
MDMNKDEQHGHTHGHAAWKRTYRTDIDMAKQHRHGLELDKDMHHGRGCAPCMFMDMHHGRGHGHSP